MNDGKVDPKILLVTNTNGWWMRIFYNNLMNKLKDPRRVVSFLYDKLSWENMVFSKRNGIAPLPKSIRLMPTLSCNLNCQMCEIDKKADLDRELKPSDYAGILDELKTWPRKPYFYMLGGEPLFYKNCDELISLITKSGYEVMINTNGMLLSRFSRRFVDSGVSTVIISLDGRENFHDEVRRKVGLYKTVIKGLNELSAIKKEKKSAYPNVDIAAIILPNNYRELYDFLLDLNSFDIRSVTINHLKFLTEEQRELQRNFINDKFGPNHYFFPEIGVADSEYSGFDKVVLEEQIDKVEQGRGKFKFAINWGRNYGPELVKNYYSNGFGESLNKMSPMCFSIYNSLTIGPYGDLQLCHNYGIGNIREQSLKSAWNNPKARLFRKNFYEMRHGFPACMHCTSFSIKT